MKYRLKELQAADNRNVPKRIEFKLIHNISRFDLGSANILQQVQARAKAKARTKAKAEAKAKVEAKARARASRSPWIGSEILLQSLEEFARVEGIDMIRTTI